MQLSVITNVLASGTDDHFRPIFLHIPNTTDARNDLQPN